jgi:hypothetical protein
MLLLFGITVFGWVTVAMEKTKPNRFGLQPDRSVISRQPASPTKPSTTKRQPTVSLQNPLTSRDAKPKTVAPAGLKIEIVETTQQKRSYRRNAVGRWFTQRIFNSRKFYTYTSAAGQCGEFKAVATDGGIMRLEYPVGSGRYTLLSHLVVSGAAEFAIRYPGPGSATYRYRTWARVGNRC